MITTKIGNTVPLKLFVVDLASQVVDISEATVTMTVSLDGVPVLTKSVIDHLIPEEGITAIDIDPSESINFIEAIYDIKCVIEFTEGGTFDIVDDKLQVL
jgi:hypothetical protein